MTTNRERQARVRRQRSLDRRRAEILAAEGHAGSIPRGNQEPERENLGHRRREWDRLLGH